MGELIRREAAAAPQTFTGERLTAAISGQIEIEHYHRYLLAREFCRGRDVLDVASGEGYGTALLAQIARSAVGIEIDADTVTAARAEFQRPNLRYEQGDARALPLPDDSIDVVVSFETLEHLAEHDVFLSELRRVLRPDGLLIISTPDRDTYSSLGVAPNPYHVLELTRVEFEALLARHFANSAFVTQRALIGSVILRTGPDVPVRFYERRDDTLIESSEHFSRAPYVVAFASDIALPPLPNSVYVYRHDLDTDMRVRLEAEAGQRAAEQAASEAVARATAAESRAVDAERQTGAAGQRVVEAEANVERAERQAAETERRLSAIETSTTWRSTRPLRAAGERFPFLARNLRRGIKLAWWAVTLQLPRRYRSWREYRQLRLRTPSKSPADPPALLPAEPPTLLPGDIRIPSSHEPVVSVIIATYGQIGVTLACLQSIANHSPRNPIEVIVVDDAYPGPEDVSVLRDVIGIHLIRNDSNMGFLRSCNLASRVAKGRYIHMLNNDTELQDGSIDALVELLDARPGTGLVGSKLLFPNGQLQEAGGILWDDASGWNYGRGDDPSRPEYNYVREVDYCSGASFMVRRTLFESLGGFDEDFAPAYYEDVDLAFRIRAQGMKVLYEPRSMIVHHEGMSHGTDLSTGVKAHQTINQTRLVERWGATLARENYPNGQHVLRARDRARRRKVILMIDHYVAEPDRDAGSRSVIGIIESLIDAEWVVKYWPHNRGYSPVYTTALERRGVEVLDHRWPGDLDAWLRENGRELDHLLVIRPDIVTYVLPHIMRNNDAVLSFYGVDLHFARLRRQADREGNSKLLEDAAAMERLERRVWRNFDVVIYPSEEEAAVVRAMSPHTLARSIVPFCFDASPARTVPPSEGYNVLFVAGFAHPPNVDAAVFLIHEVIPRLVHEIGPVKVVLAGSNPTETVRALAGPTVEVTGYVTDEELDKLYAPSVAPGFR